MKNILALTTILIATVFFSCNPDEDVQPNSGNGGGGGQNLDPFLSFEMGGQPYNLTSSNGITSIDLAVAINQGASNAGSGMSFRNSSWPFTDRVFFQVVLPIDSTGLSTFTYDEPFIINSSRIGFGLYEFENLGAILVQWDSSNGSLDGLREYDEMDNSTFYNNITSIEYAGNHHYDTFEDVWKCDYLITGNFEMRLQNENTSEIKVVNNGEYSMIVDVLAN
jgi:hypothetical protein